MEAQVSPISPAYPLGSPALVVAGAVAALKFFVPGDPIPKGRPKARLQINEQTKNAYAQIYTPPRTREWEEHVEKSIRVQINILSRINDGQVLRLPLQGERNKPMIITLRFNLPRPQSVPKWVTIPQTARGDIDNYSKAVIDGIQNAGVIGNDRMLTDLFAYRRYAEADRPVGVEIDLTGYQ